MTRGKRVTVAVGLALSGSAIVGAALAWVNSRHLRHEQDPEKRAEARADQLTEAFTTSFVVAMFAVPGAILVAWPPRG